MGVRIMVDRDRIEEEIRQVAYEIYVHSGCLPGRDIDNWLQAERIVLERYGLIKNEEVDVESEVKEVKKRKKRECKTKTTKKASTSKKGKAKTTKTARKTKK